VRDDRQSIEEAARGWSPAASQRPVWGALRTLVGHRAKSEKVPMGAELGGHVACADCAYTTIAYNSCRNRHCPKCQGAAAKEWLADREAELLPL
jgi:Transposase zinc-binding domain